MQKVDYIIIGQGLAGSILAYQLIKRDQKVMVFDNNHWQSSSQVAAGIINPITGPRLALTEDFDIYFPQAKTIYAQLEKTLGVTLWEELHQHRVVKDQTQLEYYQQRVTDDVYRTFLGQQIDSPYFSNDSAIVEIYQSAIIDTKRLLNETRNWLQKKGNLRSIKLDYQEILSTQRGFTLDDIQARQLIFCEGFQAIKNPWLSHLPFKLSKGEILSLEIELPIKQLLNWGNWLAPFDGHTKLGSNYQWDDLSLDPSEKVKNSLLGSLNNNTKIQGQVSKHEVGIRPTTTQRKPFIGPLTNLDGAFCFNGFGSKGCLLIPHYTNMLCKHLLNQSPLNKHLTQWL